MHYLKCSHCGHFNEVKTEYQSFCGVCGKKMENNFPDWSKKHPGGSFEDYKHAVCVTEDQAVEPPPPPKPMHKGWKYLAGFAIGFALFYAVGELAGEALVRFVKHEIFSSGSIQQDWKREPFGQFGLSVETPVRLFKNDLAIPDNVRMYIDKMEYYSYEDKNNQFGIGINSLRYKPEIGSISLEGAASGSIAEMKMQPGVTNFNYSQDPFSVSELPGFIQRGTYNKEGVNIEFINSAFINGLIMYQVIVEYEAGDEKGKSIAQRVIASIEIDQGKPGQI